MDSNFYTGLFSLSGVLMGYLVNYGIERLKSKNEKKNYISKVRFDKEFEIYQQLSEKNLNMVYDAGMAVGLTRMKESYDKKEWDYDPAKLKEELESHRDSFGTHLDDAEFSNKKYAPFIDKEIFDKYKKLADLSTDVFKLFRYYINDDSRIINFRYKGTIYEKDAAKAEIEKIQKKVSALSDEILSDLRTYLSALDVEE